MAVNLDRFAQGLPDPQEAEVKAYCEGCGGEIYEGEEVYIPRRPFPWPMLQRYWGSGA